MTTPTSLPAAWRRTSRGQLTAAQLRERNETSYETTCAVRGLPVSTHIAVTATESSVLVTATDMDVLADWLFVQGGSVSRTGLPSGQTVWTLRTVTWSDSPVVPVVPVFVSVVAPSEQTVLHEIATAVAS
ncbi:hypothetical protein [Streptomyces sp. NPDC047315]|uniref:hypothetical protein n=1 Tax=Streptomyces sp. NPDC047315 TaxID=3155142 RepID=UPI0033FF81B1